MNRAAVISFGMVLAVMPSLASAKLQLRGESKENLVPGQQYTMAIFAEPTDNENEQLAVYDLGFLLTSLQGPAPTAGGVRFIQPYAVRPAEGFVYGAGAATYNVPTTVSPPPGPANFLLNVEAGTGTPLVDIVGPVKLAEVVFDVPLTATPGSRYRVAFDPNLVSISSGDPSRLDTNIEYTISTAPDAGLITVVPEPASLSLVALGGLLALRRRRVA